MRKLEKCCLCFSVHTGTLLLAWFGTLVGLMQTMLAVVYAFLVGSIVDFLKEVLEPVNEEDEERFQALLDFVGAYATLMCFVLAILFAMYTMIHVMVLVGHYKRRPSFYLPFLVIYMVQLVIMMICVALWLLIVLLSDEWALLLLNIVVDVPLVVLGLHFWHCVFSSYDQLKKENVIFGKGTHM